MLQVWILLLPFILVDTLNKSAWQRLYIAAGARDLHQVGKYCDVIICDVRR